MFSAAALTGFGSSPLHHHPHARTTPQSRSRAAAKARAVEGAEERRGRTLYEVLMVKETASAGEIKAAYRSLAKRFHPDVDPDGNGSEFLEIRRAYSTLSDAGEREVYDRNRLHGRVGFSSGMRMRVRTWETDQCW